MATAKQIANKIRSLKKQVTRLEKQRKNAAKRDKAKKKSTTSRKRTATRRRTTTRKRRR